MTEAPIVREALAEDAAALAGIEAAAFDPTYYDDILSERDFLGYIRSAHAAVGIAVGDHGQPLGYALLTLRPGLRSGRFSSLAVAREGQLLGVEKALFAWAERRVAQRGRAHLLLEIRADNAALLRRYTRRGYRVFRRVQRFYPDGTDAIKMIKALPTDSGTQTQ